MFVRRNRKINEKGTGDGTFRKIEGDGLDTNREPLVLAVTALPSAPQPMLTLGRVKNCNQIKLLLTVVCYFDVDLPNRGGGGGGRDGGEGFEPPLGASFNRLAHLFLFSFHSVGMHFLSSTRSLPNVWTYGPIL